MQSAGELLYILDIGAKSIIWIKMKFVDGRFCLTQSHSLSAPKKHTEAFINYKLAYKLAQAQY